MIYEKILVHIPSAFIRDKIIILIGGVGCAIFGISAVTAFVIKGIRLIK